MIEEKKELTNNNLQMAWECVNLSGAETEEEWREMKKKKELVKKYKDKVRYRKDDGRPYVMLTRTKQIIGKTLDEMWEKLYEIEYGIENSTMEDLFLDFCIFKRDVAKKQPKTIKEYKTTWDSNLKGLPITKRPLKELTTKDYLACFIKMTGNGKMTYKNFCNIRSVMNGIVDYAISKDIVDKNPIRYVPTTDLKFKPENKAKKKKEVYTIIDRDVLLNHLENIDEIYSLAIQLDMYLFARVGEVIALKWSDFENGGLWIQRQLLYRNLMDDNGNFAPREYYFKDNPKGDADEGFRWMPVVDEAKPILQRIKELNPNSEYLFCKDLVLEEVDISTPDENKPEIIKVIRSGEHLYVDTFNERLKTYCEECGIKYHSSHKIRFCTASSMIELGMPITQVQEYLGHADVKMTYNYIRDVVQKDQEEKKKDLDEIWSKAR